MIRFLVSRFGLVPAILVAAGLLTGPQQANALPITFEFSGTVTTVNPALAGVFSVGQSFSGSYTFESTAPDADGTAVFGTYENVSAFTFNYGGGAYVGSTAPGVGSQSGRITVGNDEPAVLFPDTYRVLAFEAIETVNGPDIGAFSVVAALLFMGDPTGTAFGSDALPLTPPPLSGFTVSEFSLGFNNGQVDVAVLGTITSFNQVPEPATLALFGIGLAGLGLAARRRREEQTVS